MSENDIWWEKEEDITAFGHGIGLPHPGPRSFFSVATWGDIGEIGISRTMPDESSKDIMFNIIDQLHESKNVDECLCFIRQLHNKGEDVQSYVIDIEDILYDSGGNTELNSKFEASPLNQIYFHIIRAYTRFSNGLPEIANEIWDDIYENWLHLVPLMRRPYILSQLSCTSLCVGDWEKSSEYASHMWSLMRLMDSNKRHAYGVWDEWISTLLVSWFFMKYSQEYKDFFKKNHHFKINPFEYQKKSIIMDHLSDSFITGIINKNYYRKARELNPSLPEIEYPEINSIQQ